MGIILVPHAQFMLKFVLASCYLQYVTFVLNNHRYTGKNAKNDATSIVKTNHI